MRGAAACLGRRPSRRQVILASLAAAAVTLVAVLVTGWGPGRATAAASPHVADLGVVDVRGWTSTPHVLVDDGLRRGYLLIRPTSPGRGPLPVVMVLHGRNMTPAAMVRRSGLLAGARAIVVVPAGYGMSWNAGACCAAAHAARIDDVTFLSRVVAQVLASQRDADRRAVFLAGYSNGGRMAYRMACQRPGMFAAVAAVEAVSVYPCVSIATPERLLVVASTGDPLLRLTPGSPAEPIGGYAQPSVEDVVRSWRTLDGCPATPLLRQVGRVSEQAWTACRAGSGVQLDVYRGGGHAWPTGSATGSATGSTGTPSAGAVLWSFFGMAERAA